jgi:predicted HicB family RNase H-like nuclease
VNEISISTSVRLPQSLHERLRAEAERQDRSANSLLVHYLRRGLDEDEHRREQHG